MKMMIKGERRKLCHMALGARDRDSNSNLLQTHRHLAIRMSIYDL